jgi:rSAM/selenodomain-associated transferase 1
MDLIVLAKEPVPGRVKTRLCPPCTPETASAIAAAALADTLAAACRSGADRVVVALDGRPGDWCPPGVAMVPQGTGGLDQRLTRAWQATRGPALQIGMDTPQLTPADFDAAMARLATPGTDAVLGPALDGGWWAIGLRRPHPFTFIGVPTSRPDTGRRQLARLSALGLSVATLPPQRDVDTWDDALAVATDAPHTDFATAVRHQTAALELAS